MQVRAKRLAEAGLSDGSASNHSSDYINTMFESKFDVYRGRQSAGQRARSADYAPAVNNSADEHPSQIPAPSLHSSHEIEAVPPLMFDSPATGALMAAAGAVASSTSWPRSMSSSFIQSVLQPVDTPPKQGTSSIIAPHASSIAQISPAEASLPAVAAAAPPTSAAVRNTLRQLPSCAGRQRLRLAYSGLQLLHACPQSEHEGFLLGQVFPVLLHLLSLAPAVSMSLPQQALPLLQEHTDQSTANGNDTSTDRHGSTARALTFGSSAQGAGVSSSQALAAEQWAHQQAEAAEDATAEWKAIHVMISALEQLSPSLLEQRWSECRQQLQRVAAALLRGGGCSGDEPPPELSHPAPDMRMYTVFTVPHCVFHSVGKALGHSGSQALTWLFGVCGGGQSLPVPAHRLLQGILSVPSIGCTCLATLCSGALADCAPINGSLGGVPRAKGTYVARSAVVAAATMGMAHCGQLDDILAPAAARGLADAVAQSLCDAHTPAVEAGASAATEAQWTRKLTAQAGIMLGSAGVHAVAVAAATSPHVAVRTAAVAATRRSLLYASAGKLRRALGAAACVLVAPDAVAAQLACDATGLPVGAADAPAVQVLLAPQSPEGAYASSTQRSLAADADCVPVLGGPTPFKLQQRAPRPGAQTQPPAAARRPSSQTATTTAPAPFASPAGPTLGQAAAAAAGSASPSHSAPPPPPSTGVGPGMLSPGAVLRKHITAALPRVPMQGRVPTDAANAVTGGWAHACGADGPIARVLSSGHAKQSASDGSLSRVCIVIKASAAVEALGAVASSLPHGAVAPSGSASDVFPLTSGAVLVALTAAQQDPCAEVRARALQSVAALRGDGMACLAQSCLQPAAERYLRAVLEGALQQGVWGGHPLIAASAYQPEWDNCESEAKPFAEGMARWRSELRGGGSARAAGGAAAVSPCGLEAIADAWEHSHGATRDSVLATDALCSDQALFLHFSGAMLQAAPQGAARGSTAAQGARTRAVVGFDSMHVARGQALRAVFAAALQSTGVQGGADGLEAAQVAAHIALAVPHLRKSVLAGSVKSVQLVAGVGRAWALGVHGGLTAPASGGAALVASLLRGLIGGSSDAYATVRHAAWSAVAAVPLATAVACGGGLHTALEGAARDASPSVRAAVQSAVAATALALAAAVPALESMCGPAGDGGCEGGASCGDVLRPLQALLRGQWDALRAIITPNGSNLCSVLFPQGSSHGLRALAGVGSRGLALLLGAAQDPTRNAGERRLALASLGRVPVCSMVLCGEALSLQAAHRELLLASREGGVYTFPGAPAAALHALLQQHKQLHGMQGCGGGQMGDNGSDPAVVEWLRGALQPDTGGVSALASSSALLQVASTALGSRNPNIKTAACRVLTAPSTNTKHQGVLLLLHILRTGGPSVRQQVAAAEALGSLRAPWLLRSLLSIAAGAHHEVAFAVCSALPSCDADATAAYILHKRSVKHALAVAAQAKALLSSSVSSAEQRSLERAGEAVFVLPMPAAVWLSQLLAALRLSGWTVGSVASSQQLQLTDAPTQEVDSEGVQGGADAAARAAELKAEVEAMLARRRGGMVEVVEDSQPALDIASGNGVSWSSSASVDEEPLPAITASVPAADTEDPFVASIMQSKTTAKQAFSQAQRGQVRVFSGDWELAGQSQLYSPSHAAQRDTQQGDSFAISARSLSRQDKPENMDRKHDIRARVQVGEPLSPGE